MPCVFFLACVHEMTVLQHLTVTITAEDAASLLSFLFSFTTAILLFSFLLFPFQSFFITHHLFPLLFPFLFPAFQICSLVFPSNLFCFPVCLPLLEWLPSYKLIYNFFWVQETMEVWALLRAFWFIFEAVRVPVWLDWADCMLIPL